MIKYVKYYFPSFSALLMFFFYMHGAYYPTLYLLGYSLFFLLGDAFMPRDNGVVECSYPVLLDLAIYINLPILTAMVFFNVSLFSQHLPAWYLNFVNSCFAINFLQLKASFHLIDKIAIIMHTALFVGILGIIPAHELTHRKKSKFDMFIGNWLLAFSWDCNFAIEHVYGHHRNVGLPEDPATARRGENIYIFLCKAIILEQIAGWRLEAMNLKKQQRRLFCFHNKMIIGYLRSLTLTALMFIFAGLTAMLYFLLCALLAKIFLETINYIEHYGLVRQPGQPVNERHSWNSNHMLSSIATYNVTRHPSHHRNATMKYWQLKTNLDASPMMPYGYLTMLYLALFLPYFYKKAMAKKLAHWDKHFATTAERNIVNDQ